MTVVVDIEPTNRCNAKCYFCPRDATPHQGLMTPEVFGHAAGGPSGEGVQGLAGQQQVAQKDGQGDRRRQRRLAPRQRRQVTLGQLGQLQPVQEVSDQGGGADLQGLQGCVPPGHRHGRRRMQDRGRAVGYGSGGGDDNGARRAEKSLAGLGCDGGQPGQDFFTRQGGLRPRGTGVG